jgi:hypothetical protein
MRAADSRGFELFQQSLVVDVEIEGAGGRVEIGAVNEKCDLLSWVEPIA